MTLDIDTALTAAERTEAARHLIGRARDGELVDLAVVSALDLCVLGGPRHPLFDEEVARAWLRLGDRQRTKVLESVTEFMLGRGLLIDEGLRTSARPRSGNYALKPELGLMLAARCRPSFIVVTEAEGQDLRTAAVRAGGPGRAGARVRRGDASRAAPGPGGRLPGRQEARAAGLDLPVCPRLAGQAAEVLARWTISPPRAFRPRCARRVPGVRLPPGPEEPGRPRAAGPGRRQPGPGWRPEDRDGPSTTSPGSGPSCSA